MQERQEAQRMTIRSQLTQASDKNSPWAALEDVAKTAIDSMKGAGGHTSTLTATVDRTEGPHKWKVSVEIETVIP
jgi:hypothetical protein